jgi:hypothetical protein
MPRNLEDEASDCASGFDLKGHGFVLILIGKGTASAVP